MSPPVTRQDHVAELMSRDLTTGQIALRLKLTRGQVARTVANIKAALGAQAQ